MNGNNLVQEHEGRSTHLDNVARVAYFSSNAVEVFWGFEKDEVYRQYPYFHLTSFANSRECNDASKTQVSYFTPLCRPWYTEARDANPPGRAVFGKVDIDAVTGRIYGCEWCGGWEVFVENVTLDENHTT